MLMSISKEELIDKILELDKINRDLAERFVVWIEERKRLIEELGRLRKENEILREEIARLKKLPKKPVLQKNKLENSGQDREKKDLEKKDSSWSKTSKNLVPTRIQVVKLDKVPEGFTLKEYTSWFVQERPVQVEVIEFQRAHYKKTDGGICTAPLPIGYEGHFGPQLRAHIIYQNQVNRVPQAKILQQLRDEGFQISAGEIDNILAAGANAFKKEQEEMLHAGLAGAKMVQVDDTGARHAGKNGVCTYIGNEFFSYFKSTDSKSRLNFLNLVRGKYSEYTLNDEAIAYIKQAKVPALITTFLENNRGLVAQDQATWEKCLQDAQIIVTKTSKNNIKLLTEGAIIGTIFAHDLNPEVLLSDGAPQFKLFQHALCWIHAIRSINTLVPSNNDEQVELARMWEMVHQYYKSLKGYQATPNEQSKHELLQLFDEIFINQELCFGALQAGLINIYRQKEALLKVLDFPHIPLHNNGSEREIREYVTKRKISGGTRSTTGRDLRDVFTSLSKTCRKHNISFWKFLNDRMLHTNLIPYLPGLIIQKMHVLDAQHPRSSR